MAAIRRALRLVPVDSGGCRIQLAGPAINSWFGAGAFRSRCRSSWSASALWIRLGILETPVFQKLLDDDKVEKAPILEVIKKQPREIILSALLRMSEQAPFYIFTAFVFAYTSAP